MINRLKHVADTPFKRLTYTSAIELLKTAVDEGHKFENNEIVWGMDMSSEHERYCIPVMPLCVHNRWPMPAMHLFMVFGCRCSILLPHVWMHLASTHDAQNVVLDWSAGICVNQCSSSPLLCTTTRRTSRRST